MRVIVVGSGPVGLIMGHALLAAGITDFVMLERRDEVVEAVGTTLVIWPQTLRLFDQLGHNIYERATEAIPPTHRHVRIGTSRRIITATNLFDYIKENHGHGISLFERQKLCKLLYETLPRRDTYILTGKNVVSLKETQHDVTVTCKDGSEYTGDIVIGADGVHSIIRKLTQSLAPKFRRSKPDFKTTYKILFGISSLVKTVKVGVVSEHSEGGVLSQCMSNKDSTCWFIYVPKKKDAKTPSKKYTIDDMSAVADQFRDYVVSVNEDDTSDYTTFSDIWDARDPERPCGMVDLQEGVASTWSNGRTVLIGDAVGKMLPYLGLGVNTGAQHIVTILNHLQPFIAREKETGKLPTVDELNNVWDNVKEEHESKVANMVWLSSFTVRWACRINTLFTMLYTMFPSLKKDERMPADKIYSRLITGQRVFDFLPERNLGKPRMAYKFHPTVDG